MSTPKNNIVRSVAPKSLFESALNVIDSTVSFNQGDLLRFDTSTRKLALIGAEANASTFLGVARVTVVSGKLASPYSTSNDAATAIVDIPGPQYGVVASLTLKTGETLHAGALVYSDPSDGDQYVQASGTKAIGVYQGPGVTGSAAGLQVECLLGARYPDDALKF